MSREKLYPMVFEDNYHVAIWGGNKMGETFKRTGIPEGCAESWEISGHESGVSIVKNGVFKGRGLDELTEQYGEELLGSKAMGLKKFPLLFKLLDAADKLSVQVHPNERTALVTGGEPKSEVWYLLSGRGPLCVGLKDGVDEEQLENAINDNTVADLLVEQKVSPNELIYIPGGITHAIIADALIYEVQQSSNTTYRLYDWGRVDKNGKPRELHLEKGLKSVDYNLPVPKVAKEVVSPFFTLREMDVPGEAVFQSNVESFTVIFVKSGDGELVYDGGTIALPHGQSVLIPANTGVKVTGTMKLLVTTL